MTSGSATNGAQQYKLLSLESEVYSASPHRLIQILMDGVLGKIASARYCIENNNIPGKGESISTAISIVNGLQASLDMEKGGEISENLSNLYDYMARRLLEANIKSDKTILDEIESLLTEIKMAWDTIHTEALASAQVSG